MKYFVNKRPEEITETEYIGGQLLIPSTEHKNWQGAFGIYAGEFSEFDAAKFKALLYRDKTNRLQCKFITLPHIESNPRRTEDIFGMWEAFIPLELRVDAWPITMVMQDGVENTEIPWKIMAGIYLAGSAAWRSSKEATDLIKTALLLKKWVHVAGVNTAEQFQLFHALGAQSCSGMFPF